MLTLDLATRIARAAMIDGEARGLKVMAVVVTDRDGMPDVDHAIIVAAGLSVRG